jgi:hypothetical protein
MLSLLVPYVRSIIKSTTRPSAVSWFGWSFLFAIATAAQASKGIDWSLAVPLISTISTAVIASTALYLGRAVWTRTDIVCVVFGMLAVILWAITQEPLTAIILSIVTDISVTVPTIIKTYRDPVSEPTTLWVLYVISSILAILATKQFTIYNLLYPSYAVLGSIIIATLSSRKVRKASTPA